MPSVSLGRYEIEEYDPPEVCMKCGAPSSVVVRKTFSWYPPWVGTLALVGFLFFTPLFVIFLIVGLVMTKRMPMRIPLCDKHKGHWTMRTLVSLLGFLGVLCFVGLAIFASVSDGDLSDLAGAFWILVVVLFLAWLITVAILQSTAIRPTEITDRSITLRGVSQGYIEALREDRGDSYDDDRPRSRRRDDDDDDDRPRKRRPLAEDEDDEAPRPKAKDRSEGIIDPKKPKRRSEDSEAIQSDDE